MGAATDLLRRRAMMPQGDDYLKGWTMNAKIDQGVSPAVKIVAADGICVSPYFAVPSGCAKIRYKYGRDGVVNLQQRQCDDDHLTKTQQTYGHGFVTSWSIVSGATCILMNCYMEDIDDCYLLDLTNNAYIWKGKNVT